MKIPAGLTDLLFQIIHVRQKMSWAGLTLIGTGKFVMKEYEKLIEKQSKTV